MRLLSDNGEEKETGEEEEEKKTRMWYLHAVEQLKRNMAAIMAGRQEGG